MSEDDDRVKRTLPLSGLARRRFLSRTAFATAGTSAAFLSVMGGHMATRSTALASPNNCPGVTTPMKRVDGKTAFITGGSSGIGLGIARAFADAGMNIALGYRTQKHLDEAMKYLSSAGDRIHAINVDVTDRAGMEKAADEIIKVFGRVHVLVNNAGIAHPASLKHTTYDDWDWTMAVNLDGVFNGVHAFLPRIEAHGEGGHIIATSSILGLFALGGVLAAYTVSKFAVVGLMEVLRADLAGTNIGVSVFCPGTVRSNIAASGRNRPSDLPDTSFNPNPDVTDGEKGLSTSSEMEPLEAGKAVLRGMLNNDLYILTHPEHEPILRARSDAIATSISTDQPLPKSRVAMARTTAQSSIYATERDRKRCARERKRER